MSRNSHTHGHAAWQGDVNPECSSTIAASLPYSARFSISPESLFKAACAEALGERGEVLLSVAAVGDEAGAGIAAPRRAACGRLSPYGRLSWSPLHSFLTPWMATF